MPPFKLPRICVSASPTRAPPPRIDHTRAGRPSRPLFVHQHTTYLRSSLFESVPSPLLSAAWNVMWANASAPATDSVALMRAAAAAVLCVEDMGREVQRRRHRRYLEQQDC